MSDQNLNPFDDQPAYGKMTLGQFAMPGIIVEIDGADRGYQWDKQKAVGKGGASSVYKGEEIADSIKVKCALVNADHFAELQAVRAAVGLPDVARCVARPGAAGYSMMYKLGSTVLVGFVEGDPARPFIAFGPEVEDPANGISLPTSVTIAVEPGSVVEVGAQADEINLGAAAGAVVRDGDTVRIVVPGTPPYALEGLLSITSLSVSKVKA